MAYNNYYSPNQNMVNNLLRQKENIDNLISQYSQQQTPINNIINSTPENKRDMYEMKKLNENDEVENIGIINDSIFIGSNKMQIKKLDGTIEKYKIEKYYPIDEKDKQIKELNKKIEELERRLNYEPTRTIESNQPINKSDTATDELPNTTAKTTSKSVQKSK